MHTETITLPIELTNSNDGRGHHFARTAQRRKMFERNLRLQGFTRTPFPFPVKLTVIRVLGKGQKLWDASSIGRGNWKELEDALVAMGWFHDDSPKYITEIDFRQDECRRSSGPCVSLVIEQTGKPFKADGSTEKMKI